MCVARSGTQKTSSVSSLDQALMQNLMEIGDQSCCILAEPPGGMMVRIYLSKYYSMQFVVRGEAMLD